MKRILIVLIVLAALGALVLLLLSQKPRPAEFTYGMSFNTPYARELGLDWRETYDAILDDLGVRYLRLAAHWPMVEPERDQFNFAELDYQLERAQAVDAKVVFAVGRRLPRWPECHIPDWVREESWELQKAELRQYIEAVVNRYKDNSAIEYWQVENEPYLAVFAFEHCGPLDEDFLEEEIALVKSLDPTRPVLVTDSGNLGTWTGAYRNGDAFGTSVYVHFWNPELGQFRTILPPWFYRVKENLMKLLYGDKETFLIELSAEPWLLEPITDVDIEVQYSRMDIDKLNDILAYAKGTHLERQYLWGAEWWYWLRDKGHPEMWQRGRELFE
ncbi:MAG: beta-galactosidase [Patescibacteria group bacterium]